MAYPAVQPELFEEPDDYALENNPEVIYVKVLDNFDFDLFRDEEKRYYTALADFNRKLVEKQKETDSQKNHAVESESKEDAYQRLLFEIIDNEPCKDSILYEIPSMGLVEIKQVHHNPKGAGRKPKEFYALAKAFLGVSYMGLNNSPAVVYSQLNNNPPFARKCGFKYVIDKETKQIQHNIPSLRKLEQFDQIMNIYGIWDSMKWKMVNRNLDDGKVKVEEDLVFDPSHIEGNSSFTTVKAVDEKGKKVKRAVGALSKRCSCSDKDNCEHPWEVTDHGCGVVVKSQNKKYWAHKASFVGFPKSQVPIDAVALNSASTNDGKTLIPHLERLQKHLPIAVEKATRIFADGPFNTIENKNFVRDEIGAVLYAPINPRNGKVPSAEGLKGIDHFTKCGVPICDARFPLEMRGRDISSHEYIWGPPLSVNNNKTITACSHCLLKNNCCPQGKGRTLRTKAGDFPQIDWDNPQHLSRWKKQYRKRTSIERMIKLLKVDYRAEYFNKRDSQNFQGHLDKNMIALHILISLA